MESVMSGNLDELEPLAVDLRRQRQFKDNLLRAYRTHVQAHGC
jgi:hypothetical protein